MRERPPATILEFLEHAGVQFNWTPRGKLVFLVTAETRPLMPVILSSLPVIERDLLLRSALAKRSNGTIGRASQRGPRLNQMRVTTYFRGMSQVEIFRADNERWETLCWVKPQRDGRKIGAQKLLALSAGTEPAGGKGNSYRGGSSASKE